jgi:hypothetical protein
VSGFAPRAALWAALAFAAQVAGSAPAGLIEPERDYHSFANAAAVRVKHLDLELATDFEARRLSGVVDLEVERIDPAARPSARSGSSPDPRHSSRSPLRSGRAMRSSVSPSRSTSPRETRAS